MEQTVVVYNSDLSTEPAVQTPLPGIDRQVSSSLTQRLLGAYYTPRSAADYMADWILRHDGEHILEPSFGDGIFLRAIELSADRRDFTSVQLSGVEIDEKARARLRDELLTSDVNVHCDNFLNVSPFKVQAVIGNPPYVRLRHLPSAQRECALKAAQVVIKEPMDPSGSLWMPFVLHSMRFLNTGGRLAFVLPYDFTYVRYARPLWRVLRNSFGSLHVLRTHERLFPDLLQDVVILLADDYGSHTDAVRYQAFERVEDLLKARPVVDDVLSIDDLLHGERAFISALLGKDVRHLLDTRISELTVPVRRLVTFNIGYVAGDKKFFHPSDTHIHDYQLPSSSLRPSLTSTRMIKGVGLRTSNDSSRISKLFYPDPKSLTDGERRYIAVGEEQGVSERYKCRVRAPWYLVPGTRVPDIVLSVFSERPVLLINDAKCFASNSLLCGYQVGATSEELATSWYTSLTLLQCELEIHALGGGVMVLVPREAGNVRIPKRVRVSDDHLSHIDHLLRLSQTTEAYRAGDQKVLIEQFGFSVDDIELIRQGIDTLAHWRTSARSSQQ